MSLKPQDRPGPYEILAPIDSVAWGGVYKARDTRLNRPVAFKVSAQQFSYEISVSKTSDTSPIPPEKSATLHLALRTSLVCVGEWNGVSQDVAP